MNRWMDGWVDVPGVYVRVVKAVELVSGAFQKQAQAGMNRAELFQPEVCTYVCMYVSMCGYVYMYELYPVCVMCIYTLLTLSSE